MDLKKAKQSSEITIDKLQKKKAHIGSKILQVKNKVKTAKRKTDTKQKILLGSYMKYLLKDNSLNIDSETFHLNFQKYLTRKSDLTIFDFTNIELFKKSLQT